MTAPDRDAIREQVRLALAEDIGGGDITANLIPVEATAEATVITREAMVLCGRAWFEAAFELLDPSIQIEWEAAEGAQITANQTLCRLTGPARALLTAERTALNFLQTLSATATEARRYVDAVAGTGVAILDTRKTIPGLRRAQKYAVTCGGGRNHRIGLYDGVLIKENHIAAAGSIEAAVGQARDHAPVGIPVEVEVENMAEVRAAIGAGADILLLDNMTPAQLREASAYVDGRAKLEASGGITLDTIRAVAESGIDFISIGSLTKNLHAIDLSMRFH